MSSAWDRAKEMADKQHKADSPFVRLQEDGDRVTGAFVGEPHAREVHWVDNKTVDCTDLGCSHCRVGLKKSFRVLFNFFVPEDRAMKVIEGAAKFFQAVLDARDKHALDGHLVEVTRVGKGKETIYTVVPVKPIDGAIAQAIRAAGVHTLSAIGQPSSTNAARATIPAPPPDVDPLATTQPAIDTPF
jgi:hypothetical protein